MARHRRVEWGFEACGRRLESLGKRNRAPEVSRTSLTHSSERVFHDPQLTGTTWTEEEHVAVAPGQGPPCTGWERRPPAQANPPSLGSLV